MTSRLDAMGIKTRSIENLDSLDEYHASPWIGVKDIGDGAVLLNYVPDVDSDAESYAPVLRLAEVTVGHCSLYLNRAL